MYVSLLIVITGNENDYWLNIELTVNYPEINLD